jgi:hypothetical protein
MGKITPWNQFSYRAEYKRENNYRNHQYKQQQAQQIAISRAN